MNNTLQQVIDFANNIHLLTIVMGFLAVHFTQWIKNYTGAQKQLAIVLAGVVAAVLATADLFLSGSVTSVQNILPHATEIFTIATLYYHFILGDNQVSQINTPNGQENKLDQGGDQAPRSTTPATGSAEWQSHTDLKA